MNKICKSFRQRSILIRLITFSVILSVQSPLSKAHGSMTDPRQRGSLRHENHNLHAVDWEAPTDYQAHYPAGSKLSTPGAGTSSIRKAANNNWIPYNPFNPNYHWRAGVCGDDISGRQDHLIGGKYYYNAKRVRSYMQGSVVYFETRIVTHHNGYFEFFICNIDTCPTPDISATCFKEDHCTHLRRNMDRCNSGYEQDCAPIDPHHPGRWFLPCDTKGDDDAMTMGGWHRTMSYILPPHLVCDHCVIQWYWTSANTCNPPGVEEYFTSHHAPHWGGCRGQGGAINGWPAGKPQCGGELFSEEYWQCADVRILRTPPPPNRYPLHGTPPSLPPTATTPVSQAAEFHGHHELHSQPHPRGGEEHKQPHGVHPHQASSARSISPRPAPPAPAPPVPSSQPALQATGATMVTSSGTNVVTTGSSSGSRGRTSTFLMSSGQGASVSAFGSTAGTSGSGGRVVQVNKSGLRKRR